MNIMIKSGAILLMIGLSCAAAASSFEVDPNLVQYLRHIRGYIMLFDLHPWLFYQHPINATTDYIIKKISNPEPWLNVSPESLYDRIFGSTCEQLEALYYANRELFDNLPTVDEDRSKNLVCRVSLIVRDCKLYKSNEFRQALYPAVMEALADMFMRQLEEQNRVFAPAAFLDQDINIPTTGPHQF